MFTWMLGKKPTFRTVKSEFDRKRMKMAAKLWIKKKQPSFDGDVYVENVKCVLSLTEEEKEKRKCRVNGEETTALIFSRKHLAALYLQCLMYRKELALQKGSLDDMSEICNRIYQLENVDVLLNILALRNHDSGVVETTIPDTETTFDWLECF